MKTLTTPKSEDWNQYWALDQTKRFTQVSWSKRRILHVLRKYVKKDGKALDAGCGSGFFSKFFCDEGMQTWALDFSEKALNMAQSITDGRCQLVQANLVDGTLSEKRHERFDVIFSDGLFEHFYQSDQDKIVLNLLSVLSETGALITFVPNRWSPWELIRPFYMPGIEEKPFILQELLNLNERNGMKVIERGGINTFPFPFSPDHLVGQFWGMLLFTVARKR